MKCILFILTSLIFNFSLAQKILRIDIHSIPMGTETDHDVSCNNVLEMSFDKIVMLKKIYELKALANIQRLLLYSKLKRENSIDVRGQIFIFYRKKKRKICFDRFGDLFENGRFYTNKKLIDYLKKNSFIKG